MPRYFFNLVPGQPTDEEGEELPDDAAAIEVARQTVADMSRDGPSTIPEERVVVSKEDGAVVGAVYLEELGTAPGVTSLGEQPPEHRGQSMELLDAYRASAAECQNNAEKAVDPETKATWRKLAKEWRKLCDRTQASLDALHNDQHKP